MTFKDDLTNDLDIFFNDDEFAIEIIFKTATIEGIFDNEFAQTAEGDIGVETTVPQVLVRSSDVSGDDHGETMTIDSVVYKIIGIQPDGTGMTLILLSED